MEEPVKAKEAAPIEDEPCTLGQLCEVIQEHAKSHFLKFIHNANNYQRLNLSEVTEEQLSDFRGLIKILCGNQNVLYGCFRRGAKVGDQLYLVRKLFNHTFHGVSTARNVIETQVQSLISLLEEFELADPRVALPAESTIFARVVIAAHLKRLKIGDHSFGSRDNEEKQLMQNLIRDSKAPARQQPPYQRPYQPPQPPMYHQRPNQPQPFQQPPQQAHRVVMMPQPAMRAAQQHRPLPPPAQKTKRVEPPQPKPQPKPQAKPQARPQPKVQQKAQKPQKVQPPPHQQPAPPQNDPIFPEGDDDNDDDELVHIAPDGTEVDEDGFPVYDPTLFGEDVKVEGAEYDDEIGDYGGHNENENNDEDEDEGELWNVDFGLARRPPPPAAQEEDNGGDLRGFGNNRQHEDEDDYRLARDRHWEEDHQFERNRQFEEDRQFEGGGGGGVRLFQRDFNQPEAAGVENSRYQFEDDFKYDGDYSPPHQPPAHDLGPEKPQEEMEIDERDYELRSMEDLCNLCKQKRVNCVLEPCGEVMFCYDCAMKAKKSTGRCPICRGHIDAVDAFYDAKQKQVDREPAAWD